MAVVYVATQLLEGNVLVPMVMRGSIGVPPFVVVEAAWHASEPSQRRGARPVMEG